MKLFKDSRSGYYKVRFRADFGVRTISTKTKSLQRAREFVAKSKVLELEQAAQAARLNAATVAQLLTGKAASIAAAIDDWSQWMIDAGLAPRTRENHQRYVCAWAREAKAEKRAPASVKASEIHWWVNSADHLKLGTRRVRMAAIRSFFGYCANVGFVSGDPSKLVRIRMDGLTHGQKEVKGNRVFPDADIQLLLDSTKPGADHESEFWHAATALGRWTGLRLGDICQLEWECLSESGRINVWTDKRDRRVSLAVPPVLIQTICGISRCHTLYCFPEQREIALLPDRRSLLSNQRYCRKLWMGGQQKVHPDGDLKTIAEPLPGQANKRMHCEERKHR